MLRKEIYEELRNKGFIGSLTAFYEWFKSNFLFILKPLKVLIKPMLEYM